MLTKKKIIFICTGNACRSQIAHGLLENMARDKFEVFTLLLGLDQVPVYDFSSGEPDEYLRLLDAYLRFQS